MALFVGERNGDWPACVCPVLIEFGRVLSDAMPDHCRTDLLLPLLPTLVDTRDPQSDSCGIASTGLERSRARILVDWCVNAAMSERAAASDAPVPLADDRYAMANAVDPIQYALPEATDALAFGQAQYAVRHAAAVTAWVVKAASERQLAAAIRVGLSPAAAGDAAAAVALATWKGAVATHRAAAVYAPATQPVSRLVADQ